MHLRLRLLFALALLAGAAHAADPPALVVGSKRFTESYILGEVIAQTAAPLACTRGRTGARSTTARGRADNMCGLFASLRFAPDKRRTLTARCATHCTVLQMDESTFKTLYFQNPAFGFEVVTLVAGRLIADRQRLEDRLAATTPAT